MSDEGIDRNSFHFHTPHCIPIENRGLHRSVGQEDNPNYDIRAEAMQAKHRAVNKCVNAHLGAGDDAQIADTLHSTFFSSQTPGILDEGPW